MQFPASIYTFLLDSLAIISHNPCFLFLALTISMGIRVSHQDIKRTVHHMFAVLFPSVFLRNPPNGPRALPHYLFTDGLTPRHTTIPPFKGAHTAEQLSRYAIPNTDATVSLVPTAYEVLGGLHPSTLIQVSLRGRPREVLFFENALQAAIDSGTSQASAALNFIHTIDFHIQHVRNPQLLRLHPAAHETLANVMFTHPHHKELSLATTRVLELPANKRKLGALHGVCNDQQVKILSAEHQNRQHMRRRLNMYHGRVNVDPFWLLLPH